MGGNLDWSCAPTVRRSGVNRVLHFIVFDLAKIIFIRRRAAGPVKIVERSSGQVFKANFGQHKGVQQSIDVEIFSFQTYDQYRRVFHLIDIIDRRCVRNSFRLAPTLWSLFLGGAIASERTATPARHFCLLIHDGPARTLLQACTARLRKEGGGDKRGEVLSQQYESIRLTYGPAWTQTSPGIHSKHQVDFIKSFLDLLSTPLSLVKRWSLLNSIWVHFPYRHAQLLKQKIKNELLNYAPFLLKCK